MTALSKKKTKTTKTELCAMTVQQPGGRERHASDVKRVMFDVNAFDMTAHVLFASCAGDWTRPNYVQKLCDSASPRCSPEDSHLGEHD